MAKRGYTLKSSGTRGQTVWPTWQKAFNFVAKFPQVQARKPSIVRATRIEQERFRKGWPSVYKKRFGED